MDIDALLEAFQDFEKKGKKETCPALEQFLCHVAKTGQPLISWSQFKSYFMFKLEKVMDDFHTSTPEQRGAHNPNVEYIPFEEMKARILKIVDGYNGIPFTIQRLCELLMDPKHNYTGTDKFLRGLEKNVMVVSCVYPMSEKNAPTTVNRMNGVMFSGNAPLYSGSRNINGPATPRPLTRPKLSLSSVFSTNGLPECPLGREPEAATGQNEEPHISSDSLQPEEEPSPNPGSKHKHPEEEDNLHDADEQEVKRIKFEQEEEEVVKEEKEFSCRELSPESTQPVKESGGREYQSETSSDTACDREPSSTKTDGPKREGDSPEIQDVHSDQRVDIEDKPELTEATQSFEKDTVEDSSSSSDLSDEQCPSSSKQPPSSPCSSPDLSTEGIADHSVSTDTVTEPGECD